MQDKKSGAAGAAPRKTRSPFAATQNPSLLHGRGCTRWRGVFAEWQNTPIPWHNDIIRFCVAQSSYHVPTRFARKFVRRDLTYFAAPAWRGRRFFAPGLTFRRFVIRLIFRNFYKTIRRILLCSTS
jgi:hypothetical protein